MKYFKNLKKNQVVIYVVSLMLVVAGYLNYTGSNDLKTTIQTSGTEEEITQMANIGDAQLVSSNVENDNTVNNNIVNENCLVQNENIVEKDNVDIDYFSTSKLERDTMYSQMIESYEKILNSTNSLETQKQSAQEEITKINNTKNSIMICENLIKTKGFKNNIVFVNGESISVIIEEENLTQEEVAQIQNIVGREMKSKVENIHISNK